MKARAKYFCFGCALRGNSDFFATSTVAGDIRFNFRSGSCNELLNKCMKAWGIMTRVQAFVSLTDRLSIAIENRNTNPVPLPTFYGNYAVDDVKQAITDCNGQATTSMTCT